MVDDKDYNGKLHQDAKFSTYQNARELRHRETEDERKLWQLLRNRKLKGRKFRRQHALDKYVLDFYCHECKLIVELDGGIHDIKMNREYDKARTSALNDFGFTVIRFRNEDVINDVEKVLMRISSCLV